MFTANLFRTTSSLSGWEAEGGPDKRRRSERFSYMSVREYVTPFMSPYTSVSMSKPTVAVTILASVMRSLMLTEVDGLSFRLCLVSVESSADSGFRNRTGLS